MIECRRLPAEGGRLVSDTKGRSGGSAHRGGKQSGFVDQAIIGMTIDPFRRRWLHETFTIIEDAEF